jgi:hypothetical protein
MRTSRKLASVVAAGTAFMATLGVAPTAFAQNSTSDSTMSPNYYIEARIWKDFGNGDPTHWSTSAWTYHGAALQSMTRIRDTATIQVWGGSGNFSSTCSVGFSGENPTGSCNSTASASSWVQTFYWENGNTYESDLNGVSHPTFGTYWMKVCSAASAYSQPLGIHGTTTACVG